MWPAMPWTASFTASVSVAVMHSLHRRQEQPAKR